MTSSLLDFVRSFGVAITPLVTPPPDLRRRPAMAPDWLTFNGWETAHQVAPAGGSGRWRTTCGRTTGKQPITAGGGMPRCAMCVEGSGGQGYQRHRPVIHGGKRNA